MQSARAEAFWQAFRGHEGINQAHCRETWFATPPGVTDRLLARMAAGVMRANFGPTRLFVDGHEKPLPVAGDYAVLVDRQRRPRLIWRTAGVTVTPLSAVTQDLVWRSGGGNGEREDWLGRVGATLRDMSTLHGFETHADIEMKFETLEVVWPLNVARRIRLVTPHLDRGYRPAPAPGRAAPYRSGGRSHSCADSDGGPDRGTDAACWLHQSGSRGAAACW
jgi:uncharacterized protein YhfF